MVSAPPSLRVYILAKSYPLELTWVLDQDSLLMAELEVYGAEEARTRAEAQQRAERRSQGPSASRRGLFRRSRK